MPGRGLSGSRWPSNQTKSHRPSEEASTRLREREKASYSTQRKHIYEIRKIEGEAAGTLSPEVFGLVASV
jgi:hypothetical protein